MRGGGFVDAGAGAPRGETMTTIIGDDHEREVLCKHGIGHGYGMHTCDGCCYGAEMTLQMEKELGPPPGEFCQYCGAGIGKFRREGEGTCPRCDPKRAKKNAPLS